MSKKYIYLAKKRQSPYYMEAKTICKPVGCPFTTCRTCLRKAGKTKNFNKTFQIEENLKK